MSSPSSQYRPDLCNVAGCLTRVGDAASDIIVRDQVHLTEKGSVFLISAIIVNVVTGILAGVLGSMIGALGSLISLVGTLYFLVFVIMGSMNAWTGKAKPLPVIGGMFTIIK